MSADDETTIPADDEKVSDDNDNSTWLDLVSDYFVQSDISTWVDDYFIQFNANPANVADSYDEDSVLSANGQEFKGRAGIIEKLSAMEFKADLGSINSYYRKETNFGKVNRTCMLLNAMGTINHMHGNKDVDLKFNQLFILLIDVGYRDDQTPYPALRVVDTVLSIHYPQGAENQNE